MKRQNQLDAFDMLKHFQKVMNTPKPDPMMMYKEVQMMKYRIQPRFGDVYNLDFTNEQFIEALWHLGKFDEFVARFESKVKPEEMEKFIKLVDNMRTSFQQSLHNADLRSPMQASPQKPGYELLVYKVRSKGLN